ncbi:putative glutathione gamma-glutamate hydrolase, Gamma-glutamyltransferase [Helianthus annuus]|nr:putative glutathione gamma-glutamate hydrolase, Gamma-glutamyltransferase [Helianthus annuus]
MGEQSIQTPFLKRGEEHKSSKKIWRSVIWLFISLTALILIFITTGENSSPLSLWVQVGDVWKSHKVTNKVQSSGAVESLEAVVAADDARCSEIGVSILRAGGHAVDAAVSVALCVGVVNPMASGIGGGGFMVVRSAATSRSQAFDFRETAPAAASQVNSFIMFC